MHIEDCPRCAVCWGCSPSQTFILYAANCNGQLRSFQAIHSHTLLDLHALSAGLESSKQAAAGSKQNTKPPGWAVSFPPLVAWPHAAEPDEGTPEAALLDVLRQPRSWIS